MTARGKRPRAIDFFEDDNGDGKGNEDTMEPPKKRPPTKRAKGKSKADVDTAPRKYKHKQQAFQYPFKISMAGSNGGKVSGNGGDTTSNIEEAATDQPETVQKVVEEETTCRIPVMVSGISGGKWPTAATHIRCWYCHHTFDGIPIGMPLRRIACTHPDCVVYFRRHDTGAVVGKYLKECIARGDGRTPTKYVCKGAFCSYECTKAYILGSHRGIHSEPLTLLPLMRKEVSGIGTRGKDGKVNPIATAPPIQLLKAYGGSLSIEEFRNRGSDQKATVVPDMIVPRNDVIYDTRRQKRVASRGTKKKPGSSDGGSQHKRARMVRTILKATENTTAKGICAGKGGLDVFITTAV